MKEKLLVPALNCLLGLLFLGDHWFLFRLQNGELFAIVTLILLCTTSFLINKNHPQNLTLIAMVITFLAVLSFLSTFLLA
ncbi:TPA: hypothetical protein ACINUZ_001811 [Streptococcus agalactiae]